jgi:hypothetical protein
MRFSFVFTAPGEEERKEHSSPFKTMLDDDGKRCHDCRIPHATLQSLKEPLFVTLFESGDDQALIALTGFDLVTFQELHKLFTPFSWVQMVLTWK